MQHDGQSRLQPARGALKIAQAGMKERPPDRTKELDTRK
jgi:hypothetical protein